MGADDGGCYFTDEYTAILFAEDLEKITAFLPGFHADARGHLLGSGVPRIGAAASALPAALRTFGKDGEYAPESCADHH